MLKITCFATVLLAGVGNAALAQDCACAGAQGWSKQLRTVCDVAECDNRFPSPNKQLLLRLDSKGNIRLTRVASGEELQTHSATLGAPSAMSWSPNSDAFFVNDGEGSGMWSNFRLFRIRDSQITEDDTIEKKAVALFRDRQKCGSAAVDPAVWGLGWSPDGALFYLLIQATVDRPCGEQGSFILNSEVCVHRTAKS